MKRLKTYEQLTAKEKAIIYKWISKNFNELMELMETTIQRIWTRSGMMTDEAKYDFNKPYIPGKSPGMRRSKSKGVK